MLGFKIQCSRAFLKSTEKQRCTDHAERAVPTQKSDRDPDEAVIGREVHAKLPGIAHHFGNPHHSGQTTCQNHR